MYFQLTVQCHFKNTAPFKITRGSSTTDGQFAYFTSWDSNSVYKYEMNTEKWEELPPCPHQNCGLVIVESSLTVVGGWNYTPYTNEVLTLQHGKWVEKYPPMNTAHSWPAIVSTPDGEYFIVIGGASSDWTAAVELFQVKSRRWYKLRGLPRPLPIPSATICSHVVYVIGSDGNGYLGSLEALPPTDKPIPPESLVHLISWTPLPHLPVTYSTAATLCGQLVIIGGWRNELRVSTIHQLLDGEWVEIGSMASRRKLSLVVNTSPEKILIVGGPGAKDSIEECVAL